MLADTLYNRPACERRQPADQFFMVGRGVLDDLGCAHRRRPKLQRGPVPAAGASIELAFVKSRGLYVICEAYICVEASVSVGEGVAASMRSAAKVHSMGVPEYDVCRRCM